MRDYVMMVMTRLIKQVNHENKTCSKLKNLN